MKKKIVLLFALFFVVLSFTATSHSYEIMNGPTQLIQYNASKAYEGYTLFICGGKIYLIDMLGYVVHKWEPKDVFPGMHFVLLENGNILGNTRSRGFGFGAGSPPGGARKGMRGMFFGGMVKGLVELDWNSNVVWQWEPGEEDGSLHHDFHRMPNGNTLANAWEAIPYEEVIAAGRLADQVTERGVAADVIYEIDPNGNIVWKWSAWDHRGSNSKFHLDINYITYVIPEHSRSNPDWTHFNNVDYDPDTDRILTDSREFGELYIIDHKTGDILYRWGNPSAYGAGEGPTISTPGDQILFGPHDAHWIEEGLPGAGNILIYNNGWGRTPTSYSSVVEMDPETGEIVWEYGRTFFSSHISGCQRLPNGNTFVCSGSHGHLFEVTSEREVVWEYVVSTGNWAVPMGGFGQGPPPGGFGQGGAGGQGAPPGPPPGVVGNVFRAHRYGPDYPGLAGRDLKPQGQIAEDIKGGWEPRVDLEGATQPGAKLWKKLWK